jgi:outer membrane immunogenic protein
MKKLLLAGISLAAMVGAADAADIRPVHRAPPPIMTPVSAYDWSGFYVGINGGGIWNGYSSGGLIGGTIGYNVQNGPWVFGVEGDLGFVSSGSHSYLGTVRGRIGFTWDRLLPYVTGGLAFTGGDTGGVIGAGLEYAFTPQLSAKAEYLYAGTNGGDNIFRLGLNYHFQPRGPLIARY